MKLNIYVMKMKDGEVIEELLGSVSVKDGKLVGDKVAVRLATEYLPEAKVEGIGLSDGFRLLKWLEGKIRHTYVYSRLSDGQTIKKSSVDLAVYELTKLLSVLKDALSRS